MSAEGPFLAAVIARMAEPKFNLAAYGVTYSFALIAEAPIIMIMSASTVLVKDKLSFITLRNFTYLLNGIITLILITGLLPPIFYYIAQDIIGLPENVAKLTHIASIILIPWPGAIGYRRFYQGILIRNNLTRRVAFGTVIRLMTMFMTALILYYKSDFDGVVVGAAALSVGVICEGIITRIMSQKIVKQLSEIKTPDWDNSLTYRNVFEFYYPLALTSTIGLAVHPLIIFFIGKSRFAIDSLAVLPVITSLVFIFRSMGLSFQEVGIALIGSNYQNYHKLKKFAQILGLASILGLSLIVFSPAYNLWFEHLSGLSTELTDFAIVPTKIFVLLPGLSVLLSFQRSILVNARKTTSITLATIIEVTCIILVLLITLKYLDVIGAIAVSISLVLGRMAANSYLFYPFFRVLRNTKEGLMSRPR